MPQPQRSITFNVNPHTSTVEGHRVRMKVIQSKRDKARNLVEAF